LIVNLKSSLPQNPHAFPKNTIHESFILQEASNEGGTMMTLPDYVLLLLCSTIAQKVAELEVARMSLKDFLFLNKAIQSAFTRITEQTSHKVYKLCMPLKALLLLPVPPLDPPNLPDGHCTQTWQPHLPSTQWISRDSTGLIGSGHYALLAQRLLFFFRQQVQP
jgi:hypothetical protein